jgi:hypothetical protein
VIQGTYDIIRRLGRRNYSTRFSALHALLRNISPLVIPFQSTFIVSPVVT